MTQIQLKVKWKAEINPQDLRNYLLAQKRLEPWCCVVGAKHSEWMEFGSAPAQNSSDGELERNIRDWVRLKGAPDLKKSEQEKVVQRMCYFIRKNGLKPRPFYRPAFYYMMEHMQEWFDAG